MVGLNWGWIGTCAEPASRMIAVRCVTACLHSFFIRGPPYHCVQITTCCFDKTGTLTSDHMILEGVAGTKGHELDVVTDVKTLPTAVSRVLACCQSLLQVRSLAARSALSRTARAVCLCAWFAAP